MSARIYGGAPLTLMMTVTMLQCGAAAGWWPAVMPHAAMVGTVAAWAAGFWLLWQIDAPARPPVEQIERSSSPSIPAKQGIERRSTPRFAIRCPVEVDTHEHGVSHGELQDISEGGARIAGIALLECDSRGVLRIPGIVLPIPFIVVGKNAQSEMRVRFELSGLGITTFIRQLARLVASSEQGSSFTRL